MSVKSPFCLSAPLTRQISFNIVSRTVGHSECAGINRRVVGNERVLQERRKRLHLGLESCGEHREVLVEAWTEVSVGRAIELRKADVLGCRLRSVEEESNTTAALTRAAVRSYVVLEPAHAEKQHAREPGDLLYVLVTRSRPVREGQKPNGGRARAGEVGLCRSVC